MMHAHYRTGKVVGIFAILLLIGGAAILIAIATGGFRNANKMSAPAAGTNTNMNAVANANANASKAVVPAQTTLTGSSTCLPHKDTTGPQTLECAMGLKTADNKYYALDLTAVSQTGSGMLMLQNGSTVTVSGLLTPIEMLSTDHWQKYNVQGIMSVQKLEK